MTIKSFDNTVGFIMKSKINSPDETCFNFTSGYSIDMSTTASIFLGAASFLNIWMSNNIWKAANYWWSNLQSPSLIILTSS